VEKRGKEQSLAGRLEEKKERWKGGSRKTVLDVSGPFTFKATQRFSASSITCLVMFAVYGGCRQKFKAPLSASSSIGTYITDEHSLLHSSSF
jgi:hypothetical protein